MFTCSECGEKRKSGRGLYYHYLINHKMKSDEAYERAGNDILDASESGYLKGSQDDPDVMTGKVKQSRFMRFEIQYSGRPKRDLEKRKEYDKYF